MAEDYPTVGSMGGDAEARLARLEALWAQAQQMGLDDLLGGNHGAQRYMRDKTRIDQNGAIFKSGGDQVAYLFFLEEMSATPNDQVGAAAGASISSGTLGRQRFVIEAAPGLTGFPGSQLNNFVGLILDYDRDGLQIAGVRGTSAEDGVFTLVEALVEVGDGPTYTNAQHFRISGGPLLLEGATSDLVAAVAGMFGYRTDTTKPRFYDGAWKNIALEDWVTTNTVAAGVILGAYKDADQENTGTVLATDSELSVTLAGTSKYQIEANLFILNDGATEGYKVAVTGTVGIQDLKAQIEIYDDTLNTIVGFARVTAIDTAVGAGLSSGSNYAAIRATIETTTAGTFALSFAQNAAGASAGVHHEIGCSLQVVKVE